MRAHATDSVRSNASELVRSKGSDPVEHPYARTRIVLVVLLSVPIGVYAFLFYFVPTVGDPDFKARFATMPVFAAFHVLAAGVALLIGGLQFSSWLRARAINIHRWLGRTYLTMVLIGGTGGLMLATIASGGLVARVGFLMLAVIWLYSGACAYLAIRRGDIETHRQWMIRNFSLTFAAVTLRIYLGTLTSGLGYSTDEAYPTVAWVSWVPNLVIAEWFLIRRPRGAGARAQGAARV